MRRVRRPIGAKLECNERQKLDVAGRVVACLCAIESANAEKVWTQVEAAAENVHKRKIERNSFAQLIANVAGPTGRRLVDEKSVLKTSGRRQCEIAARRRPSLTLNCRTASFNEQKC